MSKQEKMLDLVKGYKDSGLSGAAYSRKHGIHRSRLYYWIKKLNQTDSPSGFVQIKPQSPVSRTIEVNYPNGVSVAVVSI